MERDNRRGRHIVETEREYNFIYSGKFSQKETNATVSYLGNGLMVAY